ncbi:insulinase family protein [Pseudomonas sp. D8002]|uniref:insulinase family protein n=1 Tax=Pseudomonas sp. D8002 TaxID=2738816 RepID=UPI0015A1E250|nr:insulinase family protein [Pseudomonas sp. D8002]NWA91342.1 insulinase family protein [Pseudomonas sp. D8002]
MNFRAHTYLLSIFLVCLCAGAKGEILPEPIKSPSDRNNYRSIRLQNNIIALLVNDHAATKSAIAITVNAGSDQDPESLPGLAHLTEHMVFLGSRRYPDPNGISKLMGLVGGTFNAKTNRQYTDYYFHVPAPALPVAMAHLAAALSEPLFDRTYVESERKAIDAEYRMLSDNEKFRFLEAVGNAVSPRHSWARFRIGNLKTLGGDSEKIASEVARFHKLYYSSERIKLVVSGPQSLDELQHLVEHNFLSFNSGLNLPTPDHIDLWKKNAEPLIVHVQPKDSRNKLTLILTVRNEAVDEFSKPLNFILSLLNAKNEGGLQSQLQRHGLAKQVSVNVMEWRKNQSIIGVHIEMAAGAPPEISAIKEAIYDSIELVRTAGLDRWRYDELAALSKQRFLYKEKKPPLAMARSLVSNMRRYEPEDWLYGPFRMNGIAPQRIDSLLSDMASSNTLLVWESQAAPTDHVSKWLDVPYSIQQDTTLPSHTQIYTFSLPKKNPFLVDDLNLVDVNESEPLSIFNKSGTRVWYRPEKEFNMPMTAWRISIKSNSEVGLEDHVNLALLITWLNYRMQNVLQQASYAGLFGEIKIAEQGIEVGLHGLRQHQDLLLQEVLRTLMNEPINRHEFNTVVARMERYWRSQESKMPLAAANDALRIAIYPENWPSNESLSELNKASIDSFNRWRDRWLEDIHSDALVVGNLSLDTARKTGSMIHEVLKTTARTRYFVYSGPRTLDENLPPIRVRSSSHDSVLITYVPFSSSTLSAQAHSMLISQFVASRFFQKIRTQQQIGYAVSAYPSSDWRKPALILSIQSSNYGSGDIQSKVLEFLASLDREFCELDDTQLNKLKSGASNKLKLDHGGLMEMTEGYWADISRLDYSFSTRQELLEVVNKATVTDIRSAWKNLISGPKLWITLDPNRASNSRPVGVDP